MLRRVRGHFGISAPQVSVRMQVPGHLRLIGGVALVIAVIGLAGWAYDAGRRVAGFDQGASVQQLEQLRAQNEILNEETAKLRSLLAASESGLQIERAAQNLLSEKHAILLQENNRLKEDIAIYERLVRVENKRDDEVVLDQVSVRLADASSGSFQYAFLISLKGARRGKDAKFSLQLVVHPRGAPANAKILLPQEDGDRSQYEIVLRNFRRIEGRFKLPAGIEPATIEIRILETGTLKASQVVSL